MWLKEAWLFIKFHSICSKEGCCYTLNCQPLIVVVSEGVWKRINLKMNIEIFKEILYKYIDMLSTYLVYLGDDQSSAKSTYNHRNVVITWWWWWFSVSPYHLLQCIGVCICNKLYIAHSVPFYVGVCVGSDFDESILESGRRDRET